MDVEEYREWLSGCYQRQKNSISNQLSQVNSRVIETYKSYTKSGSKLNQEKINLLLQHRQNEEHTDKKSIFYAIRNGEYAQIPKRLIQLRKNLLIRNQNLEDYRDSTGATIVQVAYIYNQYKIARYIVQKHPKLGLEPFSDKFPDWLVAAYPLIAESDSGILMPYAGENILHQAIMMRNHFETRWILEFYRVHKDSFEKDPLITLLRSRAQGSFFSQGGQFYFGGYPMHFAVCTNDTDIFDLVLAYATSVGQADHGRKLSQSSLDTTTTGASSSLNNIEVPPAPAQLWSKTVLNTTETGHIDKPEVKPEDVQKARLAADQYRDDMLALGPNSIFMRDDIGNTALHICVLHHLKEMYSHILKESEAMIKKQLKIKYAECKQSFRRHFTVKGLINMGSYPVSSNINKKIEMPHGDSEYESWLKSETDKIIDERLTYALNNQYHSPLTLAASMDASMYDSADRKAGEIKKTNMLSFLLKKMRTTKWTYGPVSCTELALEGLEMPFFAWRFLEGKAVEENSKGVIELLCVSNADESIMIPEIKQLIETKWEKSFKDHFLRTAFVHFAITNFITINVAFINHIPSFQPVYFGQLAALVLYPLVLLFMVFVLVQDFPQVRKYGLLAYWGFSSKYQITRGASQFDHICKTIMVSSFFLFVGFKVYAQGQGAGNYFTWSNLHSQNTTAPTYSPTSMPVGIESASSDLTSIVSDLMHRFLRGGGNNAGQVSQNTNQQFNPQDYIEFKLCMAVCTVSAWIHMYFFLMGFNSTGPFVITIYRIISIEIPFFLRFFLIILFAFAASLTILLDNGNPDPLYGFSNFLWVVWQLIHFTVNEQIMYSPYFTSTYVPQALIPLFNVILIIFYLCVVLIMLNLLIAMIDYVYDSLIHNNLSILLVEKYNIMSSYESTLSPSELRRFRSKYCTFADQENHIIMTRDLDYSMNSSMHSFLKKSARFVLSMYETLKTGRLTASWNKYHPFCDPTRGVIPPYTSTDVISVLGQDMEEIAREEEKNLRERALLVVTAKVNALGGKGEKGREGRRRKAAAQMSLDLTNNKQKGRKRFSIASFSVSQPGTAPLVPIEEKAVFEIQSLNVEWWDEISQKKGIDKQDKISLLIIDPQNDFHSGGSLAVPNSDQDSLRIAQLIEDNLDNIHDIYVTMDSHYRGHIAHSRYWQDMKGNHPNPFTQILYRDLWKEDHIYTEEEIKRRPVWLPTFTRSSFGSKAFESGAWIPVSKEDEEWWNKYRWCNNYVSRLESQGRELVTIWPEHCLVGTRGHCIVPPIDRALQRWVAHTLKNVNYIMKGQNCNTEMYSAFRADVEDPLDPTTSLNEELLSMLKISDRLVVCGQALSHCVKYTLLDLMDAWTKEPSLVCLLKDGCSPVRGYENASMDFLRYLEREGVRVITTNEVFAT